MDEYPAVERVDEPTTVTGAVRRWIIDHEERTSFLVFYVGAAVLLSILISLFWLVVVVAVHFLLEWIRHAHVHDDPVRVFGESAWEVKLDASLVLIALALTVYIPVVFGVLGLATAARAAGASARFIAWQRVIRGIAISIDDGLLVMRGAVKKFTRKTQDPPDAQKKRHSLLDEEAEKSHKTDATPKDPPRSRPVDPDLPSWRSRWNLLDWGAIVIGVASVVLIVIAPWMSDHTVGSVMHEIWWDLHPWPN